MCCFFVLLCQCSPPPVISLSFLLMIRPPPSSPLFPFFFLMIRRPPRSTPLSLHDALPISLIHAHVVFNPAAGRGAAARALDPIAREFHRQGWSVDVERTEGPGHGAELAARAVQAGGQRVGAGGGGGTAPAVADGVGRPRGGGGGAAGGVAAGAVGRIAEVTRG